MSSIKLKNYWTCRETQSRKKKKQSTEKDPEMALWFYNSGYRYNKRTNAHDEWTDGGNLSWKVEIMKKEPNGNSRTEKHNR